MDEADDDITCDTDLIDWFEANTFTDLSLGLSQAFMADVWFPDGEEDGIDDTREEVQFAVFSTGTSVEYPTTVGAFIEEVFYAVDESMPVQSWQAFSAQVQQVEGIPIRAWREPFAPSATWDDCILGDYGYRRRFSNTGTLAQFRKARLAPGRPRFIFDVLNPDGSVAAGQTRMSTMRQRWSDAEATWPDPVEVQLLAMARKTRTYTWLHAALAP